jgi:DNA-binding IclR family transcriptional regulator
VENRTLWYIAFGDPLLTRAARSGRRRVAYDRPVATPDSATVKRFMDVLEALSTEDARAARGVLPRDLAARVGRGRANVAQTLDALAGAGLVDRDDDPGPVRPGWGLYLLATRVVAARLRAVAPRYVAQLVERTGESAYALRLQGLNSLTEAEQRSPSTLHVSSWLGRPFPVYGSDAGPALLLDASREDIEARFRGVSFQQFGPNTPRGPAELYERVERARERGWALLDEEGEPGVVSAAAPVRTFTGEIIVALAVVGPRFRLLPGIEEAGRAVTAAASELSAELGYALSRPSPCTAESRSAALRSSRAALATPEISRTEGAEISSAATIAPFPRRTGAARPSRPGSGSSSTRT